MFSDFLMKSKKD